MRIFKLLIKFVLMAVVSWLLVHVLAVFGVFIAVAFPIWWLVSPENTPLFFKKSLSKAGINSSLRIALVNSAIIFLVSVVSIGVVYVENIILKHLFIPYPSERVNLVLDSGKEYEVGETFPMPVKITDIKTAINAVKIDIKYDPSMIEVDDISTDGSFATVFIEKKIDNQIGYAMISGGLTHPGYSGSGNPLFATFHLKGTRAGMAKVDFLPSSLVLANDGRGTNILVNLKPVSYLIVPLKITPSIEPAEKESEKTILNSSDEISSEEKINLFDENKTGIAVDGIDDAESKVLSASSYMVTDNKGNTFLNLLHTVDNLIIDFWNKIIKAESTNAT